MEKTITIQTNKSNAVEEWKMKEEGSWEDHGKSADHVYSILNRFGGKITLTMEEVDTLICSGQYHSTAWNDDEIDGGARTKRTIANWVKKLIKATT